MMESMAKKVAQRAGQGESRSTVFVHSRSWTVRAKYE